MGTGKNDYALQIDVVKLIGRSSLLGTLGYRVVGKPAGVDLRNTVYGSVGYGYQLEGGTTLGLTADVREATVASSRPSRELTASATTRLSANWKLQAYVLAGFGDSSPDWGAGAVLTYQIR